MNYNVYFFNYKNKKIDDKSKNRVKDGFET